MMHVSGNRVEVSGALTLDTASTVLREGSAALTQMALDADAVFDLTKVDHVDSAALTVVFALIRRAKATGHTLAVHNPPRELLSLAAVYGVSEMLPLA